MREMEIQEMRNINAGGTYYVKCSFSGCTKDWSKGYVGSASDSNTSYNYAKVWCEGQKHNHEIEVHYDDL